MKRVFLVFSVFFCILALWELIIRDNSEMVFVLPPPSSIFFRIWSSSDRLWLHAMATLKEMLGGLLLAFVAAFPLAWVMYLWSSLRSILQPFFVIIQCVPMFALAPIMVLWFDWSYTAIVIPTALMIFFPLTMNIYQGLRSTPQHLLDAFKAHDATLVQTLFKLQLPWALPHIMSGIRISAAIAGIGAVAGEWAGAQEGLGLLMIESRRSTDLEMTFAALFCLTAMSVALYGIVLLCERKVSWFRHMSLVLIVLVAAGCRTHDSPRPTQLMLDWLPNPNHVPIFIGMDKGIFLKHGINLKLIRIQDPSDSITYLFTRRADLALFYMPETYAALRKGSPLKVVGFLIKQPLNAIIVRKDSGIDEISNLNEKKIGYVVGEFGLGFLKRMMADKQIYPEKYLNVSFDLVSMLSRKRVDALYGAYWNIESEHLRSLGVETKHFPLSDFEFPHYYELIVVARDHSKHADDKFIDKFQAALQESIDFAVRNPDEAFKSYAKLNPDKGQKTLEWEMKAWLKTLPLLAKNQQNEEAVWQKFANWVEEKLPQ